MNGRERVEMLTDAAIHLIDTDGVEGLTVRRLSALLRISPSTLTSHLTNKHRIIDLILKTSGSLLLSTLDSAVRRRGLEGLVPDDEELRLVRAWLALREVSSADPGLAAAASALEAEMADLVVWLARVPPTEALTCQALVAVVTGLWVARCSRPDPLPRERAVEVLRHACRALDIEPELDRTA